MFGNPGKCEARFFGQAGLRAGLATVLPGGLSSPAAPLSVEGKWEAPQPRPCPLLSSQDYCAYKSIFPLIKHRRTMGHGKPAGWCEPNSGISVQFVPKWPVWMSAGAAQTDLLAPCWAHPPVRPWCRVSLRNVDLQTPLGLQRRLFNRLLKNFSEIWR